MTSQKNGIMEKDVERKSNIWIEGEDPICSQETEAGN